MIKLKEYYLPIFRINEYEVSDSKIVIEYDHLNTYIADEIRKAVNNDSERLFLSYSKSLTVCLLKYNNNHNGELHICFPKYVNYISFYLLEYDSKCSRIVQKYSIKKLFLLKKQLLSKEIVLSNICLDISNNKTLNQYLVNNTSNGIGLKTYASPEKDKELLLYNPNNDFCISIINMDFVFLLYSLAIKGFLTKIIVEKLLKYIKIDKDAYFSTMGNGESEKKALFHLICYLYYNQKFEINEYHRISKGRGYVGPRLDCGAYSYSEYILNGDLRNVLRQFDSSSEYYSDLERELLSICKHYLLY